ncbi:hypothetical protein MHC_01380 [Mycoplasma haemocanis str. Illinois]|uniref:Lipoprotein n=1 Tax=Mycoplasma haemocanis (strain Illinois) TaxID=1111676 RepID=H6N670_MYCHN|nr:hypothetical protein [Mycoplasma haemocanis]AEW45142.1 hypothetical protein MHC_01380 [Mycoplasma haemocanis str. Illinois]
MKFKFLKNHYKLVASSAVAVSASTLALFNPFLKEESHSLVEDMMKAFEEEERLDEIVLKRANYPPNISEEQRGYIEKVLKFERENGLCNIMFINNEREGSHYRVESGFWVGEGKFAGRNILKEFSEITSSIRIAEKCKSAGIDGKIFIKNGGNNVWNYFVEDQDKEPFKRWTPT